MIIDRECQLVRLLADSDTTNDKIFRDIMVTDRAEKRQAVSKIDALLKHQKLPIEKAVNVVPDDLLLIANQYNIDTTSLLWIYRDLKKETNIC